MIEGPGVVSVSQVSSWIGPRVLRGDKHTGTGEVRRGHEPFEIGTGFELSFCLIYYSQFSRMQYTALVYLLIYIYIVA